MSIKQVSFSIPIYIYSHFRSYLDQFNMNEVRVDDFLKALAINRAIEKSILNEFAQPNPLIIPPKLDFSVLNIPSEQFLNKVEDNA